MNAIKFILCLIILTVNCTCGQEFSEYDVPSTNISCYRCNNRHTANPKCDKDPAKGVEGGKVEELFSDEEDQCITVTDFLADHDLITQKWMKVNHKKGSSRRERSRSHIDHDQSTSAPTDTTLEAYCVTLVIFTKEYQAIPNIYRDCIKGYPEQIMNDFVNNFDFNGTQEFEMPKKGSRKCNRKVVGFNRVNVCLCQSDKCNDGNALAKLSGCDDVIMKRAIYSFVPSLIFIFLFNN